MDKRTLLSVGLCLVLLFAYQIVINYIYPPQPKPEVPAEVQAEQAVEAVPGQPESPATATLPVQAPATISSTEAPQSLSPDPALGSEQTVELANEFMRVQLTTHGGAVRHVSLLKHQADNGEPVVLNRVGDMPLMNLRGWGSAYGISGYDIEQQTPESVTFLRQLSPTLQLRRIYTITGEYNLQLEQTVTNSGEQLEVLSPYHLDLGGVTPMHNSSSERRFVGLSWHTSEGKYKSHKLAEFDPAKIPLLGIQLWAGKSILQSSENESINWAAIKTQFFVVLVDCVDFSATKVEGLKQKFPELTAKNAQIPDGIVADMTVPGLEVQPGASSSQVFRMYTGPKLYSQLKDMDNSEKEVMEFGMFGIIARMLLATMNWIHGWTHNYGIAVILMTIMLKAILWIPQTKANASMKRMQAVSPLMKEVQEKYKDKPEKMNEEMLKIYRDYGVNPVGGCLPMLLQFPIFLGFYSMLQSAIELRHESFLWIHDLAMPDTVLSIPYWDGHVFPLNPMPLIMAVSMFVSMNMTPQPAGVDNPMMKVMKFMPLMFLAFCYNFSSALSLYWTVQNLLSIVQLKYNLSRKEVTLDDLKAEAAGRRQKMKDFKKKGKK